ncbi:hypothetical protein CTI12_AA583780 [Artemisia annua]|uniref:CCHC-type domain-containing protein n=1 Tax=Artemisia annua TaxID=35608 RepID=A0A2U1KN08_ARTAN|nr:hypothetical protein CTI12_AA583780 [Artemisia annua]
MTIGTVKPRRRLQNHGDYETTAITAAINSERLTVNGFSRIQKKNKGKPLAPGKGQGKGKAKLAYAHKPKIPPPAKKEHPTKDTVCHHCGVVGHWRRNCAAYLEGLRKNKASGASTSGVWKVSVD